MAGIKLSIAVKGYSAVSKRLEKLMAIAKRPSVPMRAAAVWLTGQTLQVFSEGGRPEKWEPLSLMTLFIRAHRASQKRTGGTPMNDTGRLKGSFIPVVNEDGSSFGAATNVEYASLMQHGGLSKPNDVQIASFTRRKPTVGGKSLSSSKVTVGDYIIHFKGGSLIPARPFFPEGIGQLRTWGYHEKIKKIFRLYFNEATA